MAEVAEYRAESMISELEQMERLQIFDSNKIKIITRKRKEFEYGLQKKTIKMRDYSRYIQYEMDLLKLVAAKLKRMKINPKTTTIERSIASRVNKLFTEVIRRFPDQLTGWFSYVQFCKQVGFYSCASRVLEQMLEVHHDKPQIFRVAAKCEFEDFNSINKARKILTNGLHLHKDDKLLYKEAFSLEVKYAAQKREEAAKVNASADSDPILKGGLVRVMYDSAVKNINDIDFMIDLLNISRKHDFLAEIKNSIVNDMMVRFPTDELTWHTIAKLELNERNIDGTQSVRERIERCINSYIETLKRLPTDHMWAFYLDTVIELNKDSSSIPNFKRKKLREAFRSGCELNKLTENHYLYWIEVLQNESKCSEIGTILENATKWIPTSVPLWTERLRYHFSEGQEEIAVEVFKKGVQILGEQSLPLLKIAIQYWQLSDKDKVKEIFEGGVHSSHECISSQLKPMYLEWLALTNGMSAARKMYDSLYSIPPFCAQLHVKMAEIEIMRPSLALKRIRNVYEAACRQFGTTSTDFWLEYIKLEMMHGDPSAITSIYQRAVSSLKPAFVDTFERDFNLLKTNTVLSSS